MGKLYGCPFGGGSETREASERKLQIGVRKAGMKVLNPGEIRLGFAFGKLNGGLE